MIEVFEGRLGGGKTFYAVERMINYFASGGCVASNINLKLDKVRTFLLKRYSWELQDGQYIFLEDDQISEFHRYTPTGVFDRPSLVVIDEAHIWLNSRDWNKQTRELLTFLTQSRKCFTDIIFISQSALNMDKQIMRLVQYIWRFRDLKKFKIAALGLAWPLNQFLRVQFDYDGRTVLDKKFVMKDAAIYPLYGSYELLRKFPRLEGVQVKFDGKVKKKKGVKLKVILIVIVLGIVVTYFAWQRFSKSIGGGASIASVVSVPSVVAVASVPVDRKSEGYGIIIREVFHGIVEDEKGRKIITDQETYSAGGLCRIGKVLFCYPDKVLIAGYDGKPHIIQPRKYVASAGIVATGPESSTPALWSDNPKVDKMLGN